jgi:RNA polymerase sigma factor (sigma-70 family)
VATHATTAASARSDETARLYEKYGRQLYRYCLARLRSPEEAEDALQTTFIRVHGALTRDVTPRFEAAWLYKIAHNVCLTRSEVNVRRARNEQPTDFSEVDLAAPEASDAAYGLEEALASMPKNLRDPILLREWQGLSYAEIAESLDTSVSAVETLIFRARRHLVSTLRPVFDLGLLYSSVRLLLTRLRGAAVAAAPAKVAVGAALLAIGGAGVSTAVTVAGDKPPHHSAVLPAPTPALVSAAPAAHAVRPPTVAHVATTRTFTSAAVTQTVSSSPNAPPMPEPTATPAATPPPTPVAVPTVSTAPPPAPTATVAVETPAISIPVIPTVIPTSIELPSVTTPIVTTPSITVEVPTIQVPTLPITISVPTLP